MRLLLAILILAFPFDAVADCVNPPGEEAVLVYNTTYKTMQFCNGTHWVAMAGGITGTTIGGVKDWEEQDLADTSDFDGACEYRARFGTGWHYMHTVSPDYLLFDVSTAGFKFGAIEKASKNQYWYREDGNVAVTSGTLSPVDQMQKKCMVDSTPDDFVFTDVTGAAENVVIESNTVTVAGINTEIAVSVSGEGSPQLSIDGGPWVTSGTVENDQTLQVRLTSANEVEATRAATINLGGATATWSVTTAAAPNDCTSTTINWSPGCSVASGAMTHEESKSVNNSASGYSGTRDLSCNDGTISQSGGSCTGADSTPNSFSFTDQTGQQLNTLRTSNTITISGLTTGASVSVSGSGSPQISIDGGGWTTSGTITNGETLRVRLTTANAFSTARSATVNVGGVTDSWSVTTRAASNCSSTTTSWSNCDASSGSMTHGQNKSVTNTTSGYSGTRNLSCNDGTISQSGGSCTANLTWTAFGSGGGGHPNCSSVNPAGQPCTTPGETCRGNPRPSMITWTFYRCE